VITFYIILIDKKLSYCRETTRRL